MQKNNGKKASKRKPTQRASEGRSYSAEEVASFAFLQPRPRTKQELLEIEEVRQRWNRLRKVLLAEQERNKTSRP